MSDFEREMLNWRGYYLIRREMLDYRGGMVDGKGKWWIAMGNGRLQMEWWITKGNVDYCRDKNWIREGNVG